jgi:hypothetical protein
VVAVRQRRLRCVPREGRHGFLAGSPGRTNETGCVQGHSLAGAACARTRRL